MTKPKEIDIASLVQDFNFYPRTMISNVTVNDLAEAMRAGDALPSIRVCSQTFRVIDGYHRIGACKKLGLKTIRALLEDVTDDADFYARAVAANSAHGARYTPFDQARIIQRGKDLGLSSERLADMLHVSKARIEDVQKGWFAKNKSGAPEPIKRTIGHMAGKRLTDRQLEANRKLSGMQQAFYANQLIELFEADLIDWSNEYLVERLRELASLIVGAVSERDAA